MTFWWSKLRASSTRFAESGDLTCAHEQYDVLLLSSHERQNTPQVYSCASSISQAFTPWIVATSAHISGNQVAITLPITATA